ncbi:hypothetical protein PUNSTDRAFT_137885 [Punctularia strigosozonata HHB-11173 SS5]|uniref:CHAT domain-containing protein n=1 Tax=Punctularia strigosozonata (strain HHB-11173) TaxID=741275 RepID=R7S4P2_PUNST|nr:uncharacterized protein PUNSTDRAFT_137885 [Punctularia strigosozonata HHB-11173 SS5]EIN05203.1 hypothetical protein PUNSTDRAFT_137885 [Punctularia strigosozonata HHB-11173 SS5]
MLSYVQRALPHLTILHLACHAAQHKRNPIESGFYLPDETVHLAAAMLFTGFRSVVGTMWQMLDAHGPEESKQVYGPLFGIR